ncbi:hypothetical protein B296_00020499 [Ensete ventricosum]|uniref:Uncharacterized protein n=1 Tax=Ensete ventricosum TaxID=4639 RepID=A0A426ZWN5_ENSVE|nr:hypothetical protein B296_00020499 [Ensete ventricosum]
MGGCPYGRHRCPRATPCERAGVVPTSGASVSAAPLQAGRRHCPNSLAAGKHRRLRDGCRQPPLLATTLVGTWPCCPYRGPGYGRPPPFLAVFNAKIQQECVEQFYVIQSHHT